MKYLYFIYIFIQFYSGVLGDQDGWVDPFDMSSGEPVEYVPHNDLLVPSKPIVLKPDCKSEESRSNSYLKRTVNLILNSVHQDYYDEYKFRGHIVFEIDSSKYKKLKEFTEGSYEDLSGVDAVLSEILKKPTFDYLEEYFVPLCHKALNYVTSRSGIFTICLLSYVVVIYQMMKGHFSYWYIFKFLFINVVIFDFVFVWIRLYQTAEIDRLADTIKFKNAPSYCDPNKMTTFQLFWNIFSSVDKCKEYYQITLSDIFWSVSPGDVIVEMFTRTITKPITQIGPAIGEMILGIYNTLPFGSGFILLPITLVFIMVMTCITLSFLLNTPIKFNFFHLISFSFGDRTGSSDHRIVDRLIDTVRDISAPRILQRQESSIQREIVTNQNQERRMILNRQESNGNVPRNENEATNRSNGNETMERINGNETMERITGNETTERNNGIVENESTSNPPENDDENTVESGKNFLDRLTEVLNESSILNVTESGDTKRDDSVEIRKRKRDNGGGDE